MVTEDTILVGVESGSLDQVDPVVCERSCTIHTVNIS